DALAPSSHESPDRSKLGVGSDSVDVYVPGARLGTVMVPPSLIVPEASPVKAKLPAAPTGLVAFLTTIVPRWRLVNVHVTVSPGSSLKVAVRVARLTVL